MPRRKKNKGDRNGDHQSRKQTRTCDFILRGTAVLDHFLTSQYLVFDAMSSHIYITFSRWCPPCFHLSIVSSAVTLHQKIPSMSLARSSPTDLSPPIALA